MIYHHILVKRHFRIYNSKQTFLFPQRFDKDIAGNNPIRVIDTVIDNLKYGKLP